MQRPEFSPRIRPQPVRQNAPHLVVRRQRLRRTPRIAQRAQAESLEGFVEGMRVAQGRQFRKNLLGLAEGQRRGMAGADRVEAAHLPAGRFRRAVGEVGEGGAAPQSEGVLQEDGRLRGVAVGEGTDAVAGEAFEAVHVDVVGVHGEAVTAVHGDDGPRAQRPAQPSHQRLQRALRVRRGLPRPHLLHQRAHGHRPPRPQHQHRQQRTQPRPTHRQRGAVGTQNLSGAEDAVTHGFHCPCGRP
ncbi:hypothetical protein IQ63_13080 [Streptomyces acidiscabies]|uniref:Uncharacterized protein n=1 Tax=Streptomyces acidiscabies TaxID=42234 RepID=A0A0L0KEI8_9ACTN|nr:hypothetical protein IQ63_13080 [Streptomyces acidiscabies]